MFMYNIIFECPEEFYAIAFRLTVETNDGFKYVPNSMAVSSA